MKTKEEEYIVKNNIIQVAADKLKGSVTMQSIDKWALPDEVYHLAMQLYSDQQNKELLELFEDRVDVLQKACNEYEAEIQRLTSQNKELREKLYSINESLTNELTVRSVEIQRLTKEVEALKAERDSWPVERDQVLEDADKTITRLRELLKRARHIRFLPDSVRERLEAEIDIALNHKPDGYTN